MDFETTVNSLEVVDHKGYKQQLYRYRKNYVVCVLLLQKEEGKRYYYAVVSSKPWQGAIPTNLIATENPFSASLT